MWLVFLLDISMTHRRKALRNRSLLCTVHITSRSVSMRAMASTIPFRLRRRIHSRSVYSATLVRAKANRPSAHEKRVRALFPSGSLV
jgi:hypothetical protein